MRTRIDRVRGRLPENADPPTIFKADSNAQPIINIGVEGDFDPVTLREIAQNELSPRLERVPGVAAVTVNGGLRRQIHVELSKEKITALNLSVDRVVQTLRQENQNLPLGEVNQGDATYLVRSQGQFTSLDDIRNLVVLTREGVPVYLRDIADVVDSTEDRRQFLRIDGKPGVRMQVQQADRREHRGGGRGHPRGSGADQPRGPRHQMLVTNDQSVFIERAINNVQEHALIGGFLVVLIIFAFLRDFRSTLIVCTSIPVSVIGTFALLYFGGFTLNTMTFGGLALGIGMIVDAAIVVLENTHRHLHMGKDRMTAAIDGSEEVWSAILASTLTHIAVFVPLLFLSGTSSILFTQLSFVVMFSLAMSLFVAVTIVPVLCSRWLRTPDEEAAARASSAALYRASERSSSAMDESYRKAHPRRAGAPADRGRRRGGARRSSPCCSTRALRRAAAADRRGRGQRQRRAGHRHACRADRRGHAPARGDGEGGRARSATLITSGGGGGWRRMRRRRRQTNRGQINYPLVPRDERKRSNDEIAQDLRRELRASPASSSAPIRPAATSS